MPDYIMLKTETSKTIRLQVYLAYRNHFSYSGRLYGKALKFTNAFLLE